MPQSIQVNDFSDIKYIQKDELIKSIQDFLKEGNTLDLPIYTGSDGLMKLSEFLNKYHKENSGEILQAITQNSAASTLTEFQWDEATGQIKFPSNFNFNWYRSNFSDHYSSRDELSPENKITIIKSFENLFKILPDNLDSIKEIIDSDNNSLRKSNLNGNCISWLIDNMKSHEIYNMFFDKFPEMRQIYRESLTIKFAREKDVKFLVVLNDLNGRSQAFKEVAIEFYKQGIFTKEHLEKHTDTALEMLNHMISQNDIEGVKKLLSDVSLIKLEENASYISSLPMYLVRNKEMAELLIKHNAQCYTKSKTDYNYMVIQNSDSIQYDIDTIKTLVDNYPELYKLVRDPSNLESIFCKFNSLDKSIDFLDYALKEKIINPKDIELLNLIHEKTKYNITPQEKSEKILEIINVRFKDYEFNLNDCPEFCNQLLKLREEGLKIIRDLNKNKIIDIKNPDFLYSFFNTEDSITQNFHTYFDKLDREFFNNKTSKGIPVWWAGGTKDIRNKMVRKAQDINQEDSNGEKYWFHIAKQNSHNRRKIFMSSMQDIIKRNIDIDMNYKDSDGNNILHHLLKFKSPDDTRDIDSDLLKLMIELKEKQNSKIDFEPNNNNELPIESMLKLVKKNFGVNHYIKHVADNIEYDVKTSNGVYLFIELAQNIDEEKAKKIMSEGQAYMLDKKLKNQSDTKSKMKI